MNKAFEEILDRLEEIRKFHKRLISYEQNCGTVTEEYQQRKAVEVLDYVKEIVQEVAEEYTSTDCWIPCSDRLPEKEGVSILISCFNDVEYEFVQEAEFYRDDCGNPIFDCLCIYDKVLAWQPLPEPYRERE